MNKLKLILTLYLIFLFIFKTEAQCPGCITNMNFTISPAAPGLTPDTLPAGMVGQYYDTDVNFYLPAEFTHSTGTDVTLTKLEVLSVSGLPFGLSFQSSSANNTFFPSQNPPTTEHGCAKICGTPVFPGQYSMVVFVRAYVNTVIGNQTSDDSFVLPISILPGGAGNASFTGYNTTGCGHVTANFETNLPSNGKPGFSYEWDFGNGTTSTLETPPNASYHSPGTYQVTCQTVIDTLPFRYLKSITVTSTSCTDYSGKPDLYIKVKDLNETAIYQSAAVGNTNPPVSFTLPNVQINHNQSYLIEVWDEDTGIEAPDDNCATFQIMGNTNNITLTSGSNAISIVIEKPVFTYNDTVTVTVFASPPTPVAQAIPSDSACMGDSILISTTAAGNLQWYNDTIMLMGATEQEMYVSVSGKYVVVITDSVNGCEAQSDTLFISIFNKPPKPTFWRQGDTLRTLLAGFNLQWYHNGTAINGVTGQNCHIFASGYYKLKANTNEGCENISDSVFYQPYNIGINDGIYLADFKLYPNPNNGVFNIELISPEDRTLAISINNILGKRIYYKETALFNNSFSHEVHLNLAASVYILEIKLDGHLVRKERIIVH